MNKITQNIKAIILGLVLTLGLSYVGAQTSFGPGCAPPGCNAPVPLNVESNAQTKSGTLTVGGLGIVGDFAFLPTGVTPTAGQVLSAVNSQGKVAWTSLGASSYYQVEAQTNLTSITAQCNSGDTVIGGGIELLNNGSQEVASSHPVGTNAWQCVSKGGSMTCYAICASN